MASIPRVRFIHGQGCHLCDRARDVLDRVGVTYESVDITGDDLLEERYREWLPVVEAALRRKVSQT